MPTSLHDAMVEALRKCPDVVRDALAAADLRARGEALAEINPGSGQLVATSHRADLVLADRRKRHRTVVVVEVQLVVDTDKPHVWPVYYYGQRDKHRCAVFLVVLAPDPKVAAWARRLLRAEQPHTQFCPIVLGPAELPRVTARSTARREPYRALLSGLVYAPLDDVDAADAATEAAAAIGGSEGDKWVQLITSLLSAGAVARLLERRMETPRRNYMWEALRAEFGPRDRAEGKAEGQAQALLQVLASRRIALSRVQKKAIRDCRDSKRLLRWLRRAATAERAADVLADD